MGVHCFRSWESAQCAVLFCFYSSSLPPFSGFLQWVICPRPERVASHVFTMFRRCLLEFSWLYEYCRVQYSKVQCSICMCVAPPNSESADYALISGLRVGALGIRWDRAAGPGRAATVIACLLESLFPPRFSCFWFSDCILYFHIR